MCYVCLCVSHSSPRRGSLRPGFADMDPVDLIVASLDVKGAFPNTPWLLLEAVWKRLGLPFYNFTTRI